MTVSEGHGNGEVRRLPERPLLTSLEHERELRRPVHNPRIIELRVPAHLEMLAPARCVLTALAAFEGLDHDAVADLRLAVDEACTVLINSADAGATLLLAVDPQADALVVDVSTVCGHPDDMSLGGFSRRVLSELTDDVSTFSDGDKHVFGISLTARHKWASAN